MLKRRDFLILGGGAAAVFAAYPLAMGLIAPATTGTPAHGSSWRDPLRTSLRTEYDYAPRVEGIVPATLRGSLFRNGPGLFMRNSVRKNNLLVGDGMIQAYDFGDGKPRYRNRFMRTEKFLAEEKKGEFIYPT
jgi:all-trans-8'-apo-beta-carotenal 15,15'-oxygenase